MIIFDDGKPDMRKKEIKPGQNTRFAYGEPYCVINQPDLIPLDPCFSEKPFLIEYREIAVTHPDHFGSDKLMISGVRGIRQRDVEQTAPVKRQGDMYIITVRYPLYAGFIFAVDGRSPILYKAGISIRKYPMKFEYEFYRLDGQPISDSDLLALANTKSIILRNN